LKQLQQINYNQGILRTGINMAGAYS